MYSKLNSRIETLRLPVDANLFECEEVLKRITTSDKQIRILLPSYNRRLFFQDLRVAAIVSAASRMPNVECKWSQQISKQTHQSLIGLAGAVYGVPPVNSRIFSSISDAKRTLSQRLDILEDPPGTRETLTFAAIDTVTRTQPIALAGLSGKASFERQFGKYVREYFDRGISSRFSSSIGPNLFDTGPSIATCIYGFVYELYQNTYNHGALNSEQRVIPGLRIIRLRKRIGHQGSRDSFIQGATQFVELQNYLEAIVPKKGSYKFYEVSISDNGMGILSRYRSTLHIDPRHNSSRTEDLIMLNRIVAESLSSDKRKTNIGEGGLKKALGAVDQIHGFVSLRTGNLWVYRSATDSVKKSPREWLRAVRQSAGLPAIPGTHLSLLLLAS